MAGKEGQLNVTGHMKLMTSSSALFKKKKNQVSARNEDGRGPKAPLLGGSTTACVKKEGES